MKATASIIASDLHCACTKYIEARDKRVEGEIEALLSSYKHPFIKRLLKIPQPTKEQLLDYFAEEIEYIKCTGGWWPSQVEELKSLAYAAHPGAVTITQEHAELLKEFIKVGKLEK